MVTAQIDLSPEQWREDLRFLQKTVHEDYDFLFKKVTAEQFDAAVEQLSRDIPQLEDHEIITGLARTVSLFQYGHTSIGLSGWWNHDPIGFHQMPFHLYYFKDGIYVQGVHADYEQALGARVLKVAGVPVEETIWAFEKGTLILDPMEHLTQLFMAGKLEEVKSEAARLVNDDRYRHYDFESQFNCAG